MQSKRGIRRALEYAGWEVRWPSPTEDDPEAIVGGYGPYRQVVRFDAGRGEPTSVLTHRAGSQGVFTERWRGAWICCPLPRRSFGAYPSGTQDVVFPTIAPDATLARAGWRRQSRLAFFLRSALLPKPCSG